MLRRNVLIFHQGALGDFVLTWPLAMALARLYPQSRVRYITPAGKGKLAERALGLEWVDVETGGWHALYAAGAEWLGEGSRRMLAGAHQVISFVADEGNTWAENVFQIAGIAPVLLHPRPLDEPSPHITQFILHQLASQPVLYAAMQQMLMVSRDRGLANLWKKGPRVMIHPGSGSPDKCWPLDHYLQLASRLKSQGHDIAWITGEVEQETWSAQAIQSLESLGEVIRPESYVDLMETLSQAALFVGNDSGPGHLAGLIGVPTLSIFGPTDPEVWQPVGPRVQVIRGRGQSPADVDHVLNTIGQILSR